MVKMNQACLVLLVLNVISSSVASESEESQSEAGQRFRRGPLRPSPRGEDVISASGSVAVANYHIQSVVAPRSKSPTREYGYPFRIAPTLGPLVHAKANDLETEPEQSSVSSSVVPKAKGFGTRLSSTSSEDGSFPTKKAYLKKHKQPVYRYGANRRQDGYSSEETSAEKGLRIYRVPIYRNYDELEKSFRPRRIDGESSEYFDFSYSPKKTKRPNVSPIDPYLTPSAGPSDSFYPSVPKIKSYSSSYKPGSQSYSKETHKPTYSSYADDISTKYRPGGGHYDYHDTSYSIERNKPITGDIRKRLLDYAGAPDLYEGEPDYLREVALNKNKYGYIGNYYHPYGGSRNGDSLRDFRYAASKRSILVEKPL